MFDMAQLAMFGMAQLAMIGMSKLAIFDILKFSSTGKKVGQPELFFSVTQLILLKVSC